MTKIEMASLVLGVLGAWSFGIWLLNRWTTPIQMLIRADDFAWALQNFLCMAQFDRNSHPDGDPIPRFLRELEHRLKSLDRIDPLTMRPPKAGADMEHFQASARKCVLMAQQLEPLTPTETSPLWYDIHQEEQMLLKSLYALSARLDRFRRRKLQAQEWKPRVLRHGDPRRLTALSQYAPQPPYAGIHR